MVIPRVCSVCFYPFKRGAENPIQPSANIFHIYTMVVYKELSIFLTMRAGGAHLNTRYSRLS